MSKPSPAEREELRRERQRAWSLWLDEHCGPGCEEQLSGDFREELAVLLSQLDSEPYKSDGHGARRS